MSDKTIESLDIQIETSLGSDTASQISKASNAIKRMAENLKDVDTSRLEKLNSLFKGTKELESYAKGVKTISSAFKSMAKIDKTGMDNVKSTLKEISGMKFDFSQFKGLQNIDFSGLSKFGKNLNVAKANAKQAAAALKPIEERMTITRPGVNGGEQKNEPVKTAMVDKSAFGYNKVAMEYVDNFKVAKKSADELQQAMKNLVTPEINTTNIKKLQRELDTTSQKLNNLVAKQMNDVTMGASPTSTPMLNLERQIEETRLKLDALKAKMGEVQSAQISPKTTGLERLKPLLGSLKTGLASLGTKALSGIGSGLKFIGKSALSAGKNFITSKLSAEKFHGALNGGFKTFLKYGLGIRSVFVMVNKLRSTFTSAMNNLVQYSGTANRSISSMWNSLNALKNSLATAFAPVINAVAPYISALIDMLTDGMNAIAQFFAAITGSKTVVVAKKQNKSYAASLGSVGSSASDSADKVKDLADSLDLLDFDEINKLSDNTSSGSSGGSGGGSGSGGSGTSGMFATETVDSAFKDLADLFKNGNWDEIGDIIADGINGALSKIDTAISWDNVGDKITTICTGITSIFNRVVDKMDWSMLGKTVGDGVNTVIYTINLLFDGVDWGNLGSKLATGVNSIFTTVDWAAVGKLLTQKFNAVWETAEGFFNNLDGKAIGEDIGTALNSAMKNLNLKSAKSALSGALNTLSDVLEGFNTTVDWGSMTEKLSSAIEGFFTDVKWGELAQNIGELAGSLIVSIANVLTDIETWKAIAKALKDTVFGLFNGLFDGLFGKDNKVDVDATANVNTDPDGETGREKWKEQWGDGDTSVNADVKTNPNGREGWAAFNTDFTNEDGRRGGLHAGVSTSRTGGEIRKLLSQEWDKNNVDRFLANIEPLKTGDQLKKDTASLWDKTTISPLKIGVQGKLQNDIDTSGLGKVQVDAGVKATGIDPNGKTLLSPFTVSDVYNNGKSMKAKYTVSDINNNGQSMRAKYTVSDVNENGQSMRAKYTVSDVNSNGKTMSGKYTVSDVNSNGKSMSGQYKATANVTKLKNGKKVQAEGNFVIKAFSGISAKIKKALGLKAMGGVYSNGSWSNLPQFAGGGFVTSQKIGRFAGGGLPQHGSLFVAGEAGSEVVGNVGGRTEVLNQSQIASAIYSAMIQAMKQQNVNVDVSLQGDANTMFKVVQQKARQYTVQTGKMPFAY